MRHCCRSGATALVLLLALSALVHTQAPPATKKILFLTHAGLYKHPSLAPAEVAVTAWGKTGWRCPRTAQIYLRASSDFTS